MAVRLGISAHFGSAGILPALPGILPGRLEDSFGSEFVRMNCFVLSNSAGRMPAETGWKPALPKLKK